MKQTEKAKTNKEVEDQDNDQEPGPDPTPAVKFETRGVKTRFTPEEREVLLGELLRARREAQNAEMDFEGVKASYKARFTALEARIDQVATSLENGFEMRNRRCRVVFEPKASKKYFFDAEQEVFGPDVEKDALLVEPMTQDDFQQELLQAEAQFEAREELTLFEPAGESRGVLVVGRLKERWYAALRIAIAGRGVIEERLDAEQRAFKERADTVRLTAKRALAWLHDMLGKEGAKGFEAGIMQMVEAQKERAE